MKDEILEEIAEHCDDCKLKECCKEDECVLYRIEQIVLDKNRVYQIEVSEELSRIIEVKAENEDAAIAIVEEQYKNNEIVLGENDYITYEIKRFGGNE